MQLVKEKYDNTDTDMLFYDWCADYFSRMYTDKGSIVIALNCIYIYYRDFILEQEKEMNL